MRIIPHLALICVVQLPMCVNFPPCSHGSDWNTERLDIQGKRLEVYKQASLENLLYFTEGCPNILSGFFTPSRGNPAKQIFVFPVTEKTENCLWRLWKSFADNPMCLHGSYICLNRIPSKRRHQQNGNRTLRAGCSLQEVRSN